MKPFFSIVALGLLIVPLLRYLTFSQRLEDSASKAEAVSTLWGVGGGLLTGCFGLMILGIVIDGGRGYKRPSVAIAMLVLGILWVAIYPSGWMLGLPLIVYSLSRRLGFSPRSKRSFS